MNDADVYSLGRLLFISVLICLIFSIFWIFAIVDVLRRDFREPAVKNMWLLVVIFLHGLGAIIYYFFGKNQGKLR